MFGDSVNITTEEKQHLGAVISNSSLVPTAICLSYISSGETYGRRDEADLAGIYETQPQAAKGP